MNKKCQSETDDEYEKKVYVVVFNYYPTNNDKSRNTKRQRHADTIWCCRSKN